MKLATIDAGALETFAVAAGIRGSRVELHVLATRWELRAEGSEPLVIEAAEHPTWQMVRRLECEREGHSFDVISYEGSLEPKAIVCSTCSQTWELPGG